LLLILIEIPSSNKIQSTGAYKEEKDNSQKKKERKKKKGQKVGYQGTDIIQWRIRNQNSPMANFSTANLCVEIRGNDAVKTRTNDSNSHTICTSFFFLFVLPLSLMRLWSLAIRNCCHSAET
jgi:hypothetical protein